MTSLWILMAQGFPARLRLDEAARALNMSVSHAQKLASTGRFPVPGYKEGGTWYFDIRQVAAYLDEMARLPGVSRQQQSETA